MQFIALVIETAEFYAYEGLNALQGAVTAGANVKQKSLWDDARARAIAFDFKNGEEDFALFCSKLKTIKTKTADFYGLGLAPRSFSGLPVVDVNLFKVSELRRVSSIFGASAPAIFAPSFLLII